MSTTTSLKNYQMAYPTTAPAPTLTQSGALGMVLARQQLRAARAARRREIGKRLLHSPGEVLSSMWRALTEDPAKGLRLAYELQARKAKEVSAAATSPKPRRAPRTSAPRATTLRVKKTTAKKG
jgi:hypothetical protein